MIVILGSTYDPQYLIEMQKRRWGRMAVEDHPGVHPFNLYPYEPWGFDNKAYAPWADAGKPIGLTYDDWLILWDSDEFEERLKVAMQCCSEPYMAVCPDIPGAGLVSLEFSLFWRNKLPRHWPWYLAVQDGMTDSAVLDCLHLFTGIFLGGSDKFKQTAQHWFDMAHRYGKKFHYGRAGTIPKLRHAFRVGSDSCDSSFPLWTRERFALFCKKFDGLEDQKPFEWPALIENGR